MIKFKWIVYFTLCLFLGMMVFVTGVAFMRKSGNTGIDVAKMHMMRRE